MKILVTGSGGYLGRHVVQLGRLQGHYMLEMDLPGGDIREVGRIMSAVRGHRVEAVIHLAALVDVFDSQQRPQDYYQANVFGTIQVLEAAVRHGIPRVLLASSISVRGRMGIPESTYAWTKFMAEKAGKAYAENRGLEVTAFRITNMAGNRHQSQTHLVPNLVRAVSGGPPLKLWGSALDQVRDFIHVEDVAQALLHFAPMDVRGWSSAFRHVDIGTGMATPVRTVLALAEKLWGPIPLEAHDERDGDVPLLVADPDLAESLGWKATRSLRDILISAKEGRRPWPAS